MKDMYIVHSVDEEDWDYIVNESFPTLKEAEEFAKATLKGQFGDDTYPQEFTLTISRYIESFRLGITPTITKIVEEL